jgi:hypothetical protein
MTGESIASAARTTAFDSIAKHYEDQDRQLTVGELEKFAAELADGILAEVFERIDEMRLR